MLEKKGVFIYIGILCIALAAVLFGAYHFFFGHVQPHAVCGLNVLLVV